MLNWFKEIIKNWNKPYLQIMCEYSFECFWRNHGITNSYSKWRTEPFRISRRLEKAFSNTLEVEDFSKILLTEGEAIELYTLCNNQMNKAATKHFGYFSGITFTITSYKILFKKEGKLIVKWADKTKAGYINSKENE